ncbi:tripartite motif-containing protein 2-like [Mytilus californianus]|uniref:tripartite motif-containing protein 2-like n=1 Tax=Mytilus californianus TaxID=6549 RepID=UPI0022460147|nr:tripartite motif-containing protein 2-like [Mytilus californianus]
MASSSQGQTVPQKTLRSKIKDDHLTCAICLGNYDHPKALSCLHTFCENCIRGYIFGRNFDKVGNFPCPECKQIIQIPAGGVESFPDNFHIKSLLDALSTPARPAPPRSMTNPNAEPNSNQFTDQRGASGDPNLYPSLQRSDSEKKEYVFVGGDEMILKFGQFGGTLTDFHKPYDLAIGQTGQYAISDRSGSRILVFSNTGILLSRITCMNCKISGLTFMRDGNILVAVANAGSSIMRVYNMDGKLLEDIGEFYRFAKPSGIGINSSHQIVISDLESHTIMIFTDKRKLSTKFGSKGSGEKRFLSANFIAINQKNHIVVSDCGNNCIQVFDSTGELKHKFGSTGEGHGQLSCPMGVATDSHNNIIVADAGNFRVEIFDKKGKHIKCLVEDTDLIGNEAKPLNVAVTHKGDIAVLLVGEQFAEVRVFRWNG